MTYASWTVPAGWSIQSSHIYGTRLLLNVIPSSAYGTVTVKVFANCNTTASASATSTQSGYCSSSLTAQYSIFPNPSTNDELNIEDIREEEAVSDTEEYEVVLYDTYGKLHKQVKIRGKSNKLDVRGLRKGLYHLVIRTKYINEQHNVLIE